MPALSQDAAQAAAHIRAGKLAAFPTETVYGLGADARNPAAVAALYRLKGRPATHPLIVHLPDFAAFSSQWAADIPAAAEILATRFLPGALTMILKKKPDAPADVCGGQHTTVALRVPSHPLAQALLRKIPGGIAAPSANRFGKLSPTSPADVAAEFPDADDLLILDGGACELGIESSIVDLSRVDKKGNGKIALLRPGTISAAEIAAALGQDLAVAADNKAPRAPGQYPSHYAPQTPLLVESESALARRIAAAEKAGLKIAAYTTLPPAGWGDASPRWRKAASHPAARARELYRALRELDLMGCDTIFAESPPAGEEWQAVADRLKRASAGRGEKQNQ